MGHALSPWSMPVSSGLLMTAASRSLSCNPDPDHCVHFYCNSGLTTHPNSSAQVRAWDPVDLMDAVWGFCTKENNSEAYRHSFCLPCLSVTSLLKDSKLSAIQNPFLASELMLVIYNSSFRWTVWLSKKTERPKSTVELGKLEPVISPLKLFPHLLKRVRELSVITFTLPVHSHSQAGRDKLGKISIYDMISVILSPSSWQ